MVTLSQILILIIFVIMFVIITVGKIHRYIPALAGAGLTMAVLLFVLGNTGNAFAVLNLAEVGKLSFWIPGKEHIESHGINWQTVIFITGMMTMVEGLGSAGFFRWLCLSVTKLVHYKIVPIFFTFFIMAAFLSMFIDSITVMLFLASVTIEMSRLLKFDPVPMIIAEIFASNTGGSATMAGDPPNIIIGTAYGFNFMDFLSNTAPIAWAGVFLSLIFFYIVFRKTLKNRTGSENSDTITQYPEPASAINDLSLFRKNFVIFLFIITLLITHAMTGISVAFIGVTAVFMTLITAGNSARKIINRIDWRTLLFFIGLFVVVGGLESTGALKVFADFIQNKSKGNLFIITTIILWISAFLSAVIDNIPFAATMVPVVSNLAANVSQLHILSWGLALGTDIGGNATPIGASANVVGTAIAEREGYPISWGKFIKYAAPATIIVVALCWLLIFTLYF
jgi:Na+/H+ antiporter NhaD/arsenite permease-like protein